MTIDLQNIPYRTEFLGFGENAIHNTVNKMKQIINASYINPYVRRWAEKIIKDIPPYDKIGEVRAIHNWVRDNLRYTRDPYGMEYLQTPPTLLQLLEKHEVPMADCDDFTMLSLSLLKSIGFPVAIRIAAYNGSKKFGHVYGLVNVQGKWVVVECIKRNKELGWEAPNASRLYETEV